MFTWDCPGVEGLREHPEVPYLAITPPEAMSAETAPLPVNFVWPACPPNHRTAAKGMEGHLPPDCHGQALLGRVSMDRDWRSGRIQGCSQQAGSETPLAGSAHSLVLNTAATSSQELTVAGSGSRSTDQLVAKVGRGYATARRGCDQASAEGLDGAQRRVAFGLQLCLSLWCTHL